LQRSESFKRLLEDRLSNQAGIRHVSASTLTGNLLVIFNPDTGHPAIKSKVEQAAEDATRATEDLPPKTPTLPAKRRSDASPIPAASTSQPGPVTRVKDTLKRILPASEAQQTEVWHLMDVESVVRALETDRKRGISATTAEQRLKRYGLNAVPVTESRSKWHIFADQFVSLPVALLGAAAGLSILTGGFFDAVVIAGVVLANATIGYTTESQAEKTIQSLKRFVRPKAEVIRDGRVLEIRGEDVVVGDVLVLKPGSYVAADTRVVHSSHLSIDESVLTGESLPAAKRVTVLKRKNTPLGDRVNIAHMGTLVTGGEGIGVVVATGRHAQMGRLQLMLAETTSPETPI
jgi:Ca2+-transporting ATPase